MVSQATNKIPPQIWAEILGNLECQDLKSIRLAWKEWTGIATPFFLKPFHVRQDLMRFRRVHREYIMLAESLLCDSKQE